jgi:hypothetical protein
MPVHYRTSWAGKLPYAILVSGDEAHDILYYETGFEQLHPIPPVHDWMTERGYKYPNTWNCVTVTPKKEWAIIFSDQKICEMFMLRWL